MSAGSEFDRPGSDDKGCQCHAKAGKLSKMEFHDLEIYEPRPL